jgi:hypothetical protein
MGSQAPADAINSLMHETILGAICRLDLQNAVSLLESWNTTGADSIWSIRKAGLLMECGHQKAAESLIEEALRVVRRTRYDSRTGFRQESAEGLCLTLLYLARYSGGVRRRFSQSLPSPKKEDDGGSPFRNPDVTRRLADLHAVGANPYATLQTLLQWDLPISAGRHVEAAESFALDEGGRVTDKDPSPVVRRCYLVLRFIEESGIPVALHDDFDLDIAASLLDRVCQSLASVAFDECLPVILRTRSSKLLTNLFTRDFLARLSSERVSQLYVAAKTGISQAAKLAAEDGKTYGLWISNLRFAMKLMTHIAVRMSDVELVDAIPFSEQQVALLSSVQKRSVASDVKEMRELLYRSLSLAAWSESGVLLRGPKIDELEASDTAIARLAFFDPLMTFAGAFLECELPHALMREEEVDRLLGLVSNSSKWRAWAALRFSVLMGTQHFDAVQQKRFAEAIWSMVDPKGIPKIVRPSVLLSMPAVRSRASELAMFRQAYLGDGDPRPDRWSELGLANSRFGLPRCSRIRSIEWTRKDLQRILQLASQWLDTKRQTIAQLLAPEEQHPWMKAFNRFENLNNEYHSVLTTIEDSVLLSSHADAAIDQEAIDLLGQFDSVGLSTIRVFTTLASKGLRRWSDVVADLEEALLSGDSEAEWQSCGAIARWAEFVRKGGFRPLPQRLTDCLISQCSRAALGGRVLLLGVVRELVGILGKQFVLRYRRQLSVILKSLLAKSAYTSDPKHKTSVTDKVRIRVHCLRLCRAIRKQGVELDAMNTWCDEGARDLFAEVRNASALVSK